MKSSTAEVLPEGIASVFHTSEPACSLINTERCRRGGQYPLLEGYESAARFSALLNGTSPVRDDDAVTELEAWCLCVTMLPPAGRIEYLTAFISLLRDDTAVRERQADEAENISVCLEKLKTDPHFRALMKGLCRLSRSQSLAHPGDGSLICSTLSDIARYRGMSSLARKAGVSRENLYRALSGQGNHEFATIMKVRDLLPTLQKVGLLLAQDT